MSSTQSNLAFFVTAVAGGVSPDEALRAVDFRLDGRSEVVFPPYLEPLPQRAKLLRGPAALLLDTAARACVDAQGLGTRRAVFACHRMRQRRAFQRLGYRSDADYAREQLGITARAFRDLARLGARLESLPRSKAAFLAGELTRTQAEVVASVATPCDEDEWLECARSATVRGLKEAARRARQEACEQSVAGQQARGRSAEHEGSSDSPRADCPAHGDSPSIEEKEEEQRRRCTFAVPSGMLGKIDAVLELAARVAGAPMPAGTLWEFVAAEYLSGAPLAGSGEGPAAGDSDEAGSGEGPAAGESDEAAGGEGKQPAPGLSRSRSVTTPEDPRGYQRALERESRNWYFLPTTRPRLELHGEWKRLQPVAGEGVSREPRTPWELHHELKAALAAENRVAWQLGRLLTTIRNRRLWRTMCFASFSHYVRERLGISPRAAERLVRIDREMWSYPALQRVYHAGKLSPLVADTLVRVLRHIEPDDDIRQAWIDFARSVTFEHLTTVVRAVERLRAEQAPAHRRQLGSPAQVEAALASDAAGSPMFVTGAAATTADPPMFVIAADAGAADPPMFVTGADAVAPDSPMFATYAGAAAPDSPTSVACRYAVWMTEDEYATLAMAMEAARAAIEEKVAAEAGARREPVVTPPGIPDATCLNVLLDHFVAVYDDAGAREMRRPYAVFERDGWQCRAPGCSAYGPLHAHHVVFRAHGGSDDPDNLVTLCDFHHKALHDRWIRCIGRAPDALYWELGVDTRDGPSEAPVARVAGHRRLGDSEYWDGFRVLPIAGDRGRAA